MKKTVKLLFSFLIIIIGWLLLGIGYETKIGYPFNGICFYLGFLLIPLGFIFLIINLINLNKKTYSQKIHLLNFEKQSSHWNRNLFDLCLENLKSVNKCHYDIKSFGSWSIEFMNKRIVYDGRDSWLILQSLNLTNWIEEEVIKKEDLNDANLFSLLNRI